MKKYWVIDEAKEWGDEFEDSYGTLEEANKHARMDWGYQTKSEKAKRHIYVVKAEETEDGCADLDTSETTDEMFDSFRYEEAEELADEINSSDEWVPELAEALCKLAGMEAEYAEADGDTVESVVYAAAEKLGVSI